jgi:hypothetical protein
MKKCFLILLSVVISIIGFCQSQELEQLRLDLEKLVQMKSLLSNMYNGYTTLANGYNKISSLAKGNFELHKNYLDQLLQVAPQLRNSTMVQTILDNRSAGIAEGASAFSSLLRSGVFTNAELVSIKNQLDQFKSLTGRKVDQLNMVLTPGALRMSDQERIGSIERVDKDVGEALMALRAVVKEQTAVAAVRGQRKREIESMRTLYGLKK